MPDFDYVVIGAGSAGCALTHRLTADGRHRVLLVEAGGPDRDVWIRIPFGASRLLADPRVAWSFATEPEQGLAGQSIHWPCGKVLGGSSSINGMVYVRGDAREYDAWKAAGSDGWSYEELLPYFKRMERYPLGDPRYRGHDGPLAISRRLLDRPDPLSAAFVEACVEAGVPRVDDYNAADWSGASMLQLTTHNGMRCSAAAAFLRPALARANLKLETEAQVTRILFEGKRAVGVEYRQGGELRTARAAREVLLCAGSIQSPKVLELSGVGDPELLGRLGIPLVHPLSAVGENLVDHLIVSFGYRCKQPLTYNDFLLGPRWRQQLAYLQYRFLHRGMLASTPWTAQAICKSRPGVDRADVKIQIYLMSGSPAHGLDRHSGFSIGSFQLRPRSRGSLHVASPDPFAKPRIVANYLTDPEDQRTCVDMLRLARRIASQPALAPFIAGELRPGPAVADDDDAGLLAFARENGQTAWHPLGTCRMGDDAEAVVDSRLRVRGVAGLRVIDASIMPTSPTSNTNAPAIMIGEKGADMVLADARHPDGGLAARRSSFAGRREEADDPGALAVAHGDLLDQR